MKKLNVTFSLIVVLIGSSHTVCFASGNLASGKPIDPVMSDLPLAVAKTYQTLFPKHQLWQTLETGKGKETRYELLIFDPTSTGVHSQRVGKAFVRTRIHHKLILNSAGEVLFEQSHPISDEAVPKAVREAFQKWNRQFPQPSLFAGWYAHQDEGKARLYSAEVVLNALESYGATLRADGTFVKKVTHFQKKEVAPESEKGPDQGAANREDEPIILKHIDKLGGTYSANSYSPSTSVNVVNLGSTNVTDGDLEVVTALPEMQFLRSSKISENGLHPH